MDGELEQQIEVRKQEAKRKKIEWKAGVIASCLGNGSSFKNDDFIIESSSGEIRGSDGDTFAWGASITYQKETVFCCGGGSIHSFAPGSWEREFSVIFRRAEKIRKQRDRESNERMKRRLAEEDLTERKRWSL